jgi:hypothetical protein
MFPVGLGPVRQEYSLRGDPSLRDIVSQVQTDFSGYKLKIDNSVFFKFNARTLLDEKGGLLTAIRAHQYENGLRIPFGRTSPPMLGHVEDGDAIGTLFCY